MADQKQTQNQKWVKVYKRWETSGKTQRKFCNKEAIGFHAFKQQVSSLRKQGLIPYCRKNSGANPGSRSQGTRKTKTYQQPAFQKHSFLPVQIKERIEHETHTSADVREMDSAFCTIRFQDGSEIVLKTPASISDIRTLFSK